MNGDLTPPTETQLADARLDALAMIRASTRDPETAAGTIRALLLSSDREAWQVLIAMAGLAGALVDNFCAGQEFTTDEYLDGVRVWIVSAAPRETAR